MTDTSNTTAAPNVGATSATSIWQGITSHWLTSYPNLNARQGREIASFSQQLLPYASEIDRIAMTLAQGGYSISICERIAKTVRYLASPPQTQKVVPSISAAFDCSSIVLLGKSNRYALRDKNGRYDIGNAMSDRAAPKYLTTEMGLTSVDAAALVSGTRDDPDAPYIRTVTKLAATPDEPAIFSDGTDVFLNRWERSTVVAVPGDWSAIEEILAVLTNRNADLFEWLLNWMAAGAQRPAERRGCAPIFSSEATGIGKTSMGALWGRIVGHWRMIDGQVLGDDFTDAFADRAVVVANEVSTGSDDVRDISDKMLPWVVDEFVQLKIPHLGRQQLPNMTKWWITSNKLQTLRINPDDRRYTFVRIPLSAKTPAHVARCDSLWERQDVLSPKGEAELSAFAHHLRTRPVDWQRASKCYDTKEKLARIDANKPLTQAFLAEVATLEGFTSAANAWLNSLSESVAYGSTGTATKRAAALDELTFGNREHGTQVTAVYQVYRFYCGANNGKPLNLPNFTAAWADHFKYVYEHSEQRRVNDNGYQKRARFYLGLRYLTPADLTSIRLHEEEAEREEALAAWRHELADLEAEREAASREEAEMIADETGEMYEAT